MAGPGPAPELEVPPTGEDVHLPGPSGVPLLNGVAVTLMLVGLTIFPPVTLIGFVLFIATLVRWVKDVRASMAELPAEHGH